MPAAEPLSPAEAAELLGALAAEPGRIALAVSGGADSLALLHLAADVLPRARLHVLSVDHGLRAEARAEAQDVIARAAALGISGEFLTWQGPKPVHGIQAAAREARYGLMAGACQRAGASCLVTAHTQDDQAETLLMRLARGSGVDGLSGIAPATDWAGIRLLRPLLGTGHRRLVATLRARKVSWHEDPANASEEFERVRLRRLLPGIGLSAGALARSASRLGRARRALAAATGAAETRLVTLFPEAFASIDRQAFAAEPEEIRIRLIQRLSGRLGGASAPARLSEIERLVGALDAGRGRSLGGCRFTLRARRILIGREAGRMGLVEMELPRGGAGLWDGRFHIALGQDFGPVCVRKAHASVTRRQGLPACVAATLPVLEDADGRIFAPETALEAGSGPVLATARFGNLSPLAFLQLRL